MRITTNILTILIVFTSYLVTAQNGSETLNLSFENQTQENVLHEIEKQTDYHFYYHKGWLSQELISGSYNNISVSDMLEAIFKNTVINFHILKGNKIVLLQNTLVYDELPESFFGTPKEDSVAAPVFITQSIASNTKKQQKTETIRIGKANKNNTSKRFTLSGVIKDNSTGGALPNIALVVNHGKKGTYTNSKGFYKVELNAGFNTIEIRSLEVQNVTKSIIIYNNGTLDFNLDNAIESLDEVVVSADAKKNTNETISGKEQIDVEASKNIPLVLGERDVLKVATSLPGISTAGEGSSGFNVRGGKVDQNLILFDNAVLYNPQHFFGIFSALNPFTLGDVDIYKGSIPAEYGGRLSSVFDLKTKNGNTEKFSGEASVGPVTGNVALEIPVVKNKSALSLAGRGAYANWILRALDDKSLKNSEASFYDVTASYKYKINDNNQLKITAYGSRDDFSITSDSLYVYENKLLALNWNHRINDKNNLRTTFAHSQYNFNIDFEGDGNGNFELGFAVKETDLKLKLHRFINKKWSLDYGLSSKLYTIDPGNIRPKGEASAILPLDIPQEKALESALFLSSKIKPSEQLSLDLGVRLSYFNALGPSTQFVYETGMPRSTATITETLEFKNNETIKTFVNPEFRVAARYLFTEDFSIKAGFNSAYQYIHRLSNNTTASPIDTWKLSDLNIMPQQSNQYAVGLFKNFKDNVYELSVEGFYKTSNNILDFKTGAQILLNQHIEREVLQGEGKAYGVEFLLKKNSGKLNGWLGYTYSRSFLKLDSALNGGEQINNGDFFPSNFDKPHDISLVANYKLTKRFSLSTNFVYQTGRPVTFPVGNFTFDNADFVVFSERNQFRIPDFYRMDIGLNIEGNHKKRKLAHSFLTISVYNLLGRNNPYSVFFVTQEGDIKAKQSSIFSVPVPSITYNLKF